ncbi:LEAF RUST 10 DISEASE-RESISTANCE LOCUS RECEPTOR-LIKE PROTEIN KINASE-like 1.1, partial [Mucuna pruriens]
MSPVDLFCFLFFSLLVLILSAGYGNGHQYCPHSFTCGHLGTFHYPFTKAELPDCGLLPIHDCDNPHLPIKMIQLEKNGKFIQLNGITQQNAISILDQDFHRRLQQNTCATLNNNYSLPSPSPLYSIRIKYNVTLFQCKHSLNMKPPEHYIKHPCPDNGYDIYYDSLPSPNITEEAHSLFQSCSVLQFSSKDLTDTPDILSFVSAEMVVEVVLTYDCDQCYNKKGGQCRLDPNQKFYCDKGTLRINFSYSLFQSNVSLSSTTVHCFIVFFNELHLQVQRIRVKF